MARRIVIAVALAAGLVAGRTALSAPQVGPALQQAEAGQQRRQQDRDQALAGAAAARQEIAQLQGQLDELDAAQRSGQTSVSGKRLRLAALNARETELETELGGAQSRLARLLGALELFRRDPPPALFVAPGDVRDAVRAAILIRAVTPELEKRAADLKAQTEALHRLKRTVDAASEDLFTSESDLADRKAQIEALIAAKTALEGQDTADAELARQDITALAARAQALQDLSRGLAVTVPPAGAPEPPDPDHAGPTGKPEVFTAPVAGPPTRRFGEAEPGGGAKALGWTWRPQANAPVAAPAQGVVEYAGPLKSWNVVLILRLGGGYHLVLAGLGSATVAPGQMINEGQTVGRMVAADANPPELYLEIRKDDAPVDPARWLKSPPPGAPKR
jgi:septal ring factor EnvC (AmiA/AmiB activator)